jgi:hypothetical protein
MSGFRADLERRRAAQGGLRNPFYATADRPVELVVETTNGETWLLPWHHFVFGRHQEAGERERLVLTFVAHEVAMSGLNLGALITEVVDQRLARLRAAPGKYLKSSGEEPFIEQIQVRSLAEHTVTE